VFRAPGNNFDKTTLKLIDEQTNIKVWLYGDPTSSKFVLHRSTEIEYPIRNPDFSEFIKHYNPTSEYHVFQLHPDTWDNNKFNQFTQIIDYMIAQGVTFTTHYAYWEMKNKNRQYNLDVY